MRIYSSKYLIFSVLFGLFLCGCDGGTNPDYYTGIIEGYVIDNKNGTAIDSALVFPTCKADSLFMKNGSIMIDSLEHGGCNGLWDHPFMYSDKTGSFRFILHYHSNPDFTVQSEVVWLKVFKKGYPLWKYDYTKDTLKYLGTDNNVSRYRIIIEMNK